MNGSQAQYVIGVLLARKQVRQSQVDSALGYRKVEIGALRTRIAELERAGGATGVRRATKKKRVTSKLKAVRKRNGVWMAATRSLNKTQKAQVRQIRDTNGFRAALAAVKKLKAA